MDAGRTLGVAAMSTAALVAAAGVLASGHLGVVSGTPTVEMESLTLPKVAGELDIRMPMAPGWSVVFTGQDGNHYPSDRGIIVNMGARERGSVPSAIITVDRLGPGETGEDFAVELAGKIALVSERVEESRGEVCGKPAHLTAFSGLSAGNQRGAGQAGMSIVVVPEPGSYAYVAVLQTRNPDNPGYLAQRDAMLAGFCVGG